MALTQTTLDDWKAALTADFPSDLRLRIAPHKDWFGQEGFELTGHRKRQKQHVFRRCEYFNFAAGTSRPGAARTQDKIYAGLMTIYMRNFARFARDELGFDRLSISAASLRGARVWSQAGFEIDWDRMAERHIRETAANIQDRIALAGPHTTPEARERADAQAAAVLDNPRALWAMVDDDVMLDLRDAGPRLHCDLKPLSQHYGGSVPFSAVALASIEFEARFPLHDHACQTRLDARADAAIARNTRAQQKLQAA